MPSSVIYRGKYSISLLMMMSVTEYLIGPFGFLNTLGTNLSRKHFFYFSIHFFIDIVLENDTSYKISV